MSLSLLETFRVLSAFKPQRQSLAGAPWEAYVDWAIGQGLAPLAAYNLEYQLTGSQAPEWARDRLLSIYQGSVNDNVMKLVNFKRAVDELEGRRILLMGGASFAESLYPHVAFRPILDVQMLLRPADLDGFSGYLGQSEFKVEPALAAATGATRVLSDGRTPLLLYTQMLGPGYEAEEEAMFARAVPMRVFGKSFFRLELEDAILMLCLEHAQSGYDVPFLSFVDLRELITGASSVAGPYSRACDPAVLKARAAAWKMDRALYASLGIVARLFPATEAVAKAIQPALKRASRELLERLVVSPVGSLAGTQRMRGAERFRRLLAGGRQVMRPLENPS